MIRADWSFDAIGTRWEVSTDDPLPEDVRGRVSALIDRFDAEWSRFRADSVVSSLAGGGAVPAPADAAAMLDLYAAASAATAGAVNPLVGEALASRGYDASYSLLDRGAVPAPGDWQDVLSWSGGTLALSQPATIDVGALGKGRLVDLVMRELSGVAGDVVVDASGDIAVRGADRIALEHPYDPSRAIGVWEVTDAALCASATQRRAWGDGLHHVLDARTGIPIEQVAATWAVAPDAMTADAAATALFFDGGPEFAAAFGVQWVRMRTDGTVQWSPGCGADLFVAE